MKYAHAIALSLASGACLLAAGVAAAIGETWSCIGFGVLTLVMGALAALTWPGKGGSK